MQQMENALENKKTPEVGRLLICYKFLVREMTIRWNSLKAGTPPTAIGGVPDVAVDGVYRLQWGCCLLDRTIPEVLRAGQSESEDVGGGNLANCFSSAIGEGEAVRVLLEEPISYQLGKSAVHLDGRVATVAASDDVLLRSDRTLIRPIYEPVDREEYSSPSELLPADTRTRRDVQTSIPMAVIVRHRIPRFLSGCYQ